MSPRMKPPPSKPQFALEVAVVGNRDTASMDTVIGSACAQLWDVLSAQILDLFGSDFPVPVKDDDFPERDDSPEMIRRRVKEFFADEPPLLNVMSALAKGVDQIAAETFLRRKAAKNDVEMALDCTMPFREKDYPGDASNARQEFDANDAAGLRRFASQARQVIRLDGSYDQRAIGLPPGAKLQRTRKHLRAYTNAITLMMNNCDLLVAIFDPSKPGGPAGTQETIQRALDDQMPVLAVLVTPNRPAYFTLWRSVEERDLILDSITLNSHSWPPPQAWEDSLHELLRYLLCPPHSSPQYPGNAESPSARYLRLALLHANIKRLDIFYGHENENLPGGMTSPVMSFLLGSWWWSMLKWTGGKVCHAHGFADKDNHVTRPSSNRPKLVLDVYDPFVRRADWLTTQLMCLYRGAFVVSFLLAAVAVAAAVGILGCMLLCHNTTPALVLGALEIGIVIVLLKLEHTASEESWQELAADFRFVAELLRPMPWLAPMGAATPQVAMPAFYQPLNPRLSWEAWIVRALARTTPSVMVPRYVEAPQAKPAWPQSHQMINSYTRTAIYGAIWEWIDGQRAYHHRTAQQMHGIENGLERIAKGLLYLILVGGIMAFWIKSKFLEHSAHDSSNPWFIAAVILSVAGAVLPALIAALNGIMFQSEAMRLELRSESMYHLLTEHRRTLLELCRKAKTSGLLDDSGSLAWEAAQALRAVAELTIFEAGEWKALYQMHHVRAG